MLIGVDIGGTKCAVCLWEGETLIEKKRFATGGKAETLEKIVNTVKEFSSSGKTEAVGISCGGPLDSKKGIIMSPPNLKGWDSVPITDILSSAAGAPVRLCNDANACALAEFKHGAGKGIKNMIFLTFGTGMGAGLILDGRLYEGTNGLAGEVGHIRLESDGPVGYGKAGSFEGFCSGGGIAKLGKEAVRRELLCGNSVSFCKENEIEHLNAKIIGDAAESGDPLAREIYRISAEKLGLALSLLIDIINPERIVIGSIFARSETLLRKEAERVIKAEALFETRSVCRIVPALLGEKIGDYAALAVAEMMLEEINGGIKNV